MRGIDLLKFGITLEQLEAIKTIIAFDLGHGETTCCYTRVDGKMVPSPVNLDGDSNQKLVTALLKKNRQDNQWITLKLGRDLSFYEEVHTKFKSIPRALNMGEMEEGSDYTKKCLLQAFVKEVLKNVKIYNEGLDMDPDTVLLFIGIPSSIQWKNQDLAYADIIKEVSPYKTVIMPESRAALFKAILDKKENFNLLDNGLIVIDLGSSTLDWTYLLKDLKTRQVESEEDSINLGGGLIEDMMCEKGCFEDTVSNEEEIENLCKMMRMLPAYIGKTDKEIRIDALKAYEAGKKDRSVNVEDNTPKDLQKLRLELRAVKEEYFDSEGKLTKAVRYVTKSGKARNITVDKTFMEAEKNGVIHQKMNLNTKDGLWTGSWYEDCRRLFEDVKNTIGRRPYKTIILTGGASKMGFVLKLCREVFPDTRILLDMNPSTCVARGMAYAGEMDVRATLAFPKVMDKIMEKIQSPEFIQVYSQRAVELLNDTIYEEAIWPAFVKWKELDGGHKPREIAETSRQKLAELQARDGYKENVKTAIAEGVYSKKEDIIQIVNESFEEIYRRTIPEDYKFAIDYGQLRNICDGVIYFTFNDEFENFIEGALSFLGGTSGFLKTIDKTMDSRERAHRVDRIVTENRHPTTKKFCTKYLESMIGKLLQKSTVKEQLRNLMEPAVQTMLDDLGAYFAE